MRRYWSRLVSDTDGNGDHYDDNKVESDSMVDAGTWLDSLDG